MTYSKQKIFYGLNNMLEKGRNKRCVWRICPKPYPEAHFAVYPEELCETPIKSGCPKNGVVLDPFAGSGTTLKVARHLGRNYVGIELSADYIKLAKKRLSQQVIFL
jgi:site-specific DNA-methyltransferase (adenine-specific)